MVYIYYHQNWYLTAEKSTVNMNTQLEEMFWVVIMFIFKNPFLKKREKKIHSCKAKTVVKVSENIKFFHLNYLGIFLKNSFIKMKFICITIYLFKMSMVFIYLQSWAIITTINFRILKKNIYFSLPHPWATTNLSVSIDLSILNILANF